MIPKTQVRIELREGGTLPVAAHGSDACLDCFAREDAMIPARGQAEVKLGFALELEWGWEALPRGRGSTARMSLVTHPGTVDHLYRDEVVVIFHNYRDESVPIAAGDRCCQLAIRQCAEVSFLIVDSVKPTGRGKFGSSGSAGTPLPTATEDVDPLYSYQDRR